MQALLSQDICNPGRRPRCDYGPCGGAGEELLGVTIPGTAATGTTGHAADRGGSCPAQRDDVYRESCGPEHLSSRTKQLKALVDVDSSPQVTVHSS